MIIDVRYIHFRMNRFDSLHVIGHNEYTVLQGLTLKLILFEYIDNYSMFRYFFPLTLMNIEHDFIPKSKQFKMTCH